MTTPTKFGELMEVSKHYIAKAKSTSKNDVLIAFLAILVYLLLL